MSPAATVTAWRCSGCGVDATIGHGIHLSVLACHLPIELAVSADWRACSARGGPFFAGVESKVLEVVVREATGVDLLRESTR